VFLIGARPFTIPFQSVAQAVKEVRSDRRVSIGELGQAVRLVNRQSSRAGDVAFSDSDHRYLFPRSDFDGGSPIYTFSDSDHRYLFPRSDFDGGSPIYMRNVSARSIVTPIPLQAGVVPRSDFSAAFAQVSHPFPFRLFPDELKPVFGAQNLHKLLISRATVSVASGRRLGVLQSPVE
jgi:hypothetical protein